MHEILEYIQITLNNKRHFYVYDMTFIDFMKLVNSQNQFIELVVEEIYHTDNFHRDDYVFEPDLSNYKPKLQTIIINKNNIFEIIQSW
jgi:hypothetical protein